MPERHERLGWHWLARTGARRRQPLAELGPGRELTRLGRLQCQEAARQVEDDARIRKERLREEARLIEERIGWAKEGLAEVNDRLEQVFLENEPLALQSEPES